MFENYYDDYVADVVKALKDMKVTDCNGTELSQEKGLGTWVDKCKEIRDEKRGSFYFAGNGASASVAEHMSSDCFQNADFATVTCSEVSYITAVSNDVSFEDVFSYKINKTMKNTDMLITISSSGNSPNIVKAIGAAKAKGAYIVTISGMKPDNQSRIAGHLNFYVPTTTYGMVESAHSILLHCWLDLFLDKYMEGRH